METNRAELWYCAGCGYFFDTKENKILDIAYTEMSADFALQVMSNRQKKFRPCHITYRNKLARVKKVLLPE
jgi:hypothetical protein